MDDLLTRITMDPKVMVGKPVIKGTRITVEHIMRHLAAGWTEAELIDAHPHLTSEDIRATCAYAADRVAEDRVLAIAE
jgi:uncharacterized protein (DUF433 family)